MAAASTSTTLMVHLLLWLLAFHSALIDLMIVLLLCFFLSVPF